MAQFNKVILIGNLTRDVEVRHSQSGTTYGKFGMAINETSRDGNGEKKEKVVFVDVTAFGRTAETLAKFLGKGDPLFIEGRLDFSQWEAQDGTKRNKLSVICDRFQFLGGKKSGDEHTVNNAGTDYGDILF